MSTSYESGLTARILLGLFSGAGECLDPATISDVFLHERGIAMAYVYPYISSASS
jgi:MFS family permease